MSIDTNDHVSIKEAKEQICASLLQTGTTGDALQSICAILLKTEITPFEIANTLGVSKSQVTRWAGGRNMPLGDNFRFWAVGELLELVNRKVGAPTAPGSGGPH